MSAGRGGQVSAAQPSFPAGSSDEPKPRLSPELVREARLDLAARLGYGVYGYALIFIALGITTRYPSEHPTLFWSLAGVVFLAMGMRVTLALMRDRMYAAHPRLLIWLLTLAVAAGSGVSGLLFVSTLRSYGFENWTFVIVLLWMAGIVAGSGLSFAPNVKLLALHVVLLLGPVTLQCLLIGGAQANTFATFCLALSFFMALVGRYMHKVYWQQLHDHALEKARARELELAKTAAESANRAKGQFLANMSHEIRTPMHGILGMAELAMDSETPQESREYIKTLRSCAEGLLAVLNDILDFSKIDVGKLTLENIPFSLRHSVDQVCKLVLPQARVKGLLLECQIAEDVPDVLVGDPTRLRQVLINLVGNAAKFTESGSVKLQVSQTQFDSAKTEKIQNQADLIFQVSDTGIGISEEQQKYIFGAFAQADGGVTRRFGGSGLGLAICSQLAQLMGGHLSVESTPHVGSTFEFICTFAMGKEQDLAVQPALVAENEAPMRILLAEDNPANQLLSAKLLSRRGHKVNVVSTGLAAVDAWEATEFDLILMDDQMPVMDGVEAVRQIRSRETTNRRRRTTIVSLSASAMVGDRERFLASGMDGYLAKPFTAEELYATVRQFASSKQRIAG